MKPTVSDFIIEGFRLDRKSAETLEAELVSSPENEANRVKLIGYYQAHYYCCFDAKELRVKHIKWAIKQRPVNLDILPFCRVTLEDQAGYDVIKEALMEEISKAPNNVNLISTLAHFIRQPETDRAIELLTRCVSLKNTKQHRDNLARMKEKREILIQGWNNFLGETWRPEEGIRCGGQILE